MKTSTFAHLLLASAALTTIAVAAVPAAAQTTIASIRGQVTDAAGAPAPGASVVAVSEATNQTQRVASDAGGAYVLSGLRPGAYAITITGANGETFARTVVVSVGQSATLDAQLGTNEATGTAPAEIDTPGSAGDIVVTGSRLVETRTSEVATNISQQQIRDLPQQDRNFLTFAALAPGVRYNDSDTAKNVTSGASTASAVNVFIDGISFKSQTLDGGIAGQTQSRGNPFGQLAIGEFRVLTQNYKAEYEQAGAAVITAVTKSGTNQFHSDGFFQYTDKSLSSTDYFVKQLDLPKPEFKRKQYGVSLGGPIIKDKLFFFGAYEGNDQDRALSVILGNRTPANLARFGHYEGNFVSPFREDFYFGKLTLTPDEHQVFDASFSRRKEKDVQNFGQPTLNAYSVAENRRNTVDTYDFKWTYTGNAFVNEFHASYLNYNFNPTAVDPNTPTQEYVGVITIGGKDSTQKIVQSSYVLRNDLTYTGLSGHVIKGGIRFAFQDYEFNKLFFVQPHYTYINDPTQNLDFSFPAQAQVGLGNPRIGASNSQLGLYLQDDWDITDRLQLNLGLRWDYESNLFNNHYRTPANAVLALSQLPQTFYFNSSDYITDGSDRPPLYDLFQPRVGFSYDLFDDQRTVFFGGYGKYYDRNVFNNTLDEQFRLQYSYGQIYFSRDGQPRNGQPTVIFQPSYLTRDGLLALQAQAVTGLPELFAVKNDARPPSTDQFSLGVRQKVGVFQVSATGSYIRGRNGYTHLFATRTMNGLGACCDVTIPRRYGFGNVLIGYDGLDTRYRALYLTIEKPYTDASRYGVSIAYTLSKAEQNGNDLFSLDKVVPDDYGFRNRPGDERHRVVLSGTVLLPLDVKLSTLTTLGSGQAYTVYDQSAGTLIDQGRFFSAYPRKNCIHHVFAYCEVNLTLAKDFTVFGRRKVSAAVDLLNAFNNKNFGGFDGYEGPIDPTTGVQNDPLDRSPKSLITLPRRVQFRVGYSF